MKLNISNKELKQNHAGAYLIIKTIINKWDSAGLLAMGCPNDEYDSESAEVTRLALSPLNDTDLGKSIFTHFTNMLGSDVFKSDLNECEAVARQINKALNSEPLEYSAHKTKTISADRIVEINERELRYLDSNGDDCVIDFERCRQNWIDFVISANEFNPTKDFEDKTSCVATRDITALVFEFYCNPNVRFIIEPQATFFDCFKRYRKSRYRKRFIEIQRQIEAVGWSTFDLS